MDMNKKFPRAKQKEENGFLNCASVAFDETNHFRYDFIRKYSVWDAECGVWTKKSY